MAGRCLYKGFVYFMPATSDLKAVAPFTPWHSRSMQRVPVLLTSLFFVVKQRNAHNLNK